MDKNCIRNKSIKILGIFLVCFFFVISLNVYGKSYEVDNYNVTAVVTENGDLNISEEITYDFSGKFNGIYRNFAYKSPDSNKGIYPKSEIYMGRGISEVTTYILKNGVYQKIDNNSRNSEYYEKEFFNNGVGIRVYTKSNDEKKTIKFSYTIKDVAVSHLDASEIYWNYANDEENIRNVNVNIIFENDLNKENTYVFPHFTGDKIEKSIQNNIINIKAENLRAGKYLDARIVFENKVLGNVSKTTLENNLQNILDYEENLDKASSTLIIKIIALAIFAIISVILVIMQIINYKKVFNKYDKEYDVNKKLDACFDIPDRSRSPLEVSFFVNNGMLQNKDLIAVILDLVDRKYIKMDTVKELTKHGKEKYAYYLSKTQEDIKDLKSFEKGIYDFIFENDEKIELEEKLKEIERSTKKYNKFVEIITNAKKDLEKEVYVHEKPQKGEVKKFPTIIISIITFIAVIVTIMVQEVMGYSFIMYIINNITNYMFAAFIATVMGIIGATFSISIYKSNDKIFSMILTLIITTAIALGTVSLISAANFSIIDNIYVSLFIALIIISFITSIGILIASYLFKRTKIEYANEREKWLSLKKYISEYSYLNEKDAGNVINWGPYLVYAFSLDVADKLNKELSIMNKDQNDMMPMYMSYYAIHSIANTRIIAATTAHTSTASGSSGSSGFSGGGGGGGGSSGGAF